MAGSYNHCVSDDGQLLRPTRADFQNQVENLGDAFESIEEMFGMIWYLASGDADRVELARQHFRRGLEMSPGTDGQL